MASKRLKTVVVGSSLALAVILAAPAGLAPTAGAQTSAPVAPRLEPEEKLQSGLAALAPGPSARLAPGSEDGPTVADDRVAVEAAATVDARRLRNDLQALGLEGGTAFGFLVSGRLPVESLAAASELDSLNFMRPVAAGGSVGSTDTQGDAAMGTDLLRAAQGADGTGITVGTISTSYGCIAGGPAADIASNDLPPAASINVLDDTNCTATNNLDEGRGMMQIIHDVAPGAALSFHTGINGIPDMAQAVLDLANAGADIINDDIFYLANPFFQDGLISRAIDQVAATGVPYFASANNMDRLSYESAYRAGTGNNFCSTGTPHDFDPGPGNDVLQAVTIPAGRQLRLSFQWDQPFASVSGAPGAASNLDVCVLDAANNVVASGLTNNVGGDAVEWFNYTNNTMGTAFNVAITRRAGPDPGRVKWVDYGHQANNPVTVVDFATNSATVVGHPSAAGAEAVGAAFYFRTPVFGTNPPVLEPFSSAGGSPILFDTNGNATNVVRQKPGIVAPDGVNNTFFNGNDIPDPGDGSDTDTFPNFFGTSAAAPHAAGFAALLLDANPALTPAQMYTTLRTTAIDMGPPGVDFESGFGFIQAQSLLMAACPAPPAPGPGAIIVAGPGLLTTGTAGDDVIYGTAGDDRIAGVGGNDVVFGQGGVDRITGGEGDDTICGGAGNDLLVGGDGADTLSGDAADDDLTGGAGADRLFGGLGTDRLTGGADTDVCAPGGQAGDQIASCP